MPKIIRAALASGRAVSTLALIILSLAVGSCGGSSNGGDVDEPQATIAHIIIAPEAIMLTSMGESSPLTAMAFDADGNLIDDVEFSWSSKDPAQVSVDTSGNLTAQTSAGSAQITAMAEGVHSMPIIALVAMPVVGAVLIGDDDVAAEPVPVDEMADFDVGYQLRVTLIDGVTVPAIGATIIGTGIYLIGGVVLDATPQPDGTTIVTYAVLTLPELFTELFIEEQFDLSTFPLGEADPDGLYDGELLPNGDVLLTLRSDAGDPAQPATLAAAGVVYPAAASWNGNIGPFKCTADLTPPLQITANPGSFLFSRQVILSYALRHPQDSIDDLEYVKLDGTIKAEFEAELTVTNTLSTKVECSYAPSRAIVRIPVPAGPLGILVTGEIQFGADLSLGGEISAPGIEFKVKATAMANGLGELNCPPPGGGNCSLTGEFSAPAPTAEYKIDVPDPFLWPTSLIFEPELSAFATVVGSGGINSRIPVLGRLRGEIIKGKAGLKQVGEFSFVKNQIFDDNLAGSYDLNFEWEVGPGSFTDRVISLLGLSSSALTRSGTRKVAESPKAIRAEANFDFFSVGNEIEFTIDLDSQTTDYTSLFGYNVETIKIYRKNGASDHEFVASAAADAGQTEFTINWMANRNGSINTDGYYAFVGTTLVPIDDVGELELGKISGSGSCDTTVTVDDLLRNHDLGFEGTVTTEDGSFPIQVEFPFEETQGNLGLVLVNNDIYLSPIAQRSGGVQSADINSLVYDLAAGTISIAATYPDDSYFRDDANGIHKLTVNTLQLEGTFEIVCITPVEGIESVLTFSGTHNWGPAASWIALSYIER